MPDAGRLGDDEFEGRRGDDRRELLRHRLGERQEPGAASGGGDQRLADASARHRSKPNGATIGGMTTPSERPRRAAGARCWRPAGARSAERARAGPRGRRARTSWPGSTRDGAGAASPRTSRCAPSRARSSCWPRCTRAGCGCWCRVTLADRDLDWARVVAVRAGDLLGARTRSATADAGARAGAGGGPRRHPAGPRRRLVRPRAGPLRAGRRDVRRCCSTTRSGGGCPADPWDGRWTRGDAAAAGAALGRNTDVGARSLAVVA